MCVLTQECAEASQSIARGTAEETGIGTLKVFMCVRAMLDVSEISVHSHDHYSQINFVPLLNK